MREDKLRVPIEPYTSYVVLDDLDLTSKKLGEHFVRTEEFVGLTRDLADKAIDVLMRGNRAFLMSLLTFLDLFLTHPDLAAHESHSIPTFQTPEKSPRNNLDDLVLSPRRI